MPDHLKFILNLILGYEIHYKFNNESLAKAITDVVVQTLTEIIYLQIRK